MKKTTKLLAGALVAAIGGLAMTSIASATATVTPLAGETVNYTLNGGEQFSAGVFQVSDEETIIFILDRNLGANQAGTGCAKTGGVTSCSANDPTYGYLFQWGNNYGFDPNTTLVTGTQLSSLSTTYSPFYSNPVFVVGDSNWYNDDSKVDLWGGSYDDYIDEIIGNNWKVTNATGRQGPCPDGFHVPSYGELLKVKDMMGNNASEFHNKLLVPFAGNRSYSNAGLNSWGSVDGLWSSSPYSTSPYSTSNPKSRFLYLNVGGSLSMYDSYRAQGVSVRCFHDSYGTYTKSVSYVEPTDTDIGVTIGQTVYNELPSTMTVTTNTVQQAEGKPVLGEVSVSFGSNESAKFSKLVKINVPVDSAEQVIIKVKHAGSSEYNFDGLTTNVNASCNNGRPTSSQYNGEAVTVVDGYASIYTCEASDFVALGVENGGDSLITVNIAEFNGGQNTCTGSNYIFENIVAGTSTGTHTLSGVFQCAFGNGRSSSIVTLQLSGDLVADGDRVISGSNVQMKNSEWTVSPVGLKFANTLISTWRALTATQTLFQKTANLIGVASGVVEVQLTVPGGTPDGTYNGVLVLTY